MADLEKIAEDLSSLTGLEAADLAKILEEKWMWVNFIWNRVWKWENVEGNGKEN